MKGFGLDNKKILIFGASSGIGRQTAIQLSELGAQLVLVGRNEQRLKDTAELTTQRNRPHHILRCDVSDFNAAQNTVKEAVELDGIKLDGCLFSAGFSGLYPIKSVKECLLQEMFQTDFFSLVAILKVFSSRHISNSGASFVSISSRAGIFQDKAKGVYGAANAAINSYTAAAALELSARLIRVNAICPEAVTGTPTNASPKVGKWASLPPEQVREIYPLGILTTEDVADLAVFLLSDYSKKLTGQSIWLSAGNDGGSIKNIFFSEGDI